MEKNHLQDCCEPSEARTQPANLASLKEEILKEIGQNKSVQKRKISWASAVVTFVLVILTVVSVTQALQMTSIWKKIKSGAIKPASAESAPLPSNIQNLPNMVGGC